MCSAVRSSVRHSGLLIVPSSLPQRVTCRVRRARCGSSRRGRCFVGIEPASRASTGRSELARVSAPAGGDHCRACDFFTVESVFLRRFYVLFFIEHGTRCVHLGGCTTNPDGNWCGVSKFGARSRKMWICRWDPIFGTPQASPVAVGSRYCRFAYAGEGPKSTAMHGSSPTTQASCPGSIRATSPGPISTSVPSFIATPIRPDKAYRK